MRKSMLVYSTVLVLVFLCSFAFGISDSTIEKILSSHTEEGYKYLGKSGNAWKVNIELPDGAGYKTVYIYISPNKKNSEFDVVYVYSEIASYDSVDQIDIDTLISALEINSGVAEWGSVSLYKEESGKFYMDYNVKLKATEVDNVILLNAIGWTAARANSIKKSFINE